MRQAQDDSADEAKPKRPNVAKVLHAFTAETEWQMSVAVGEQVSVLDKMEDGWWLVDKSCGAGRGPFGLVPGVACCWTVLEEDAQRTSEWRPLPPPPPMPPRARAAPAARARRSRATFREARCGPLETFPFCPIVETP